MEKIMDVYELNGKNIFMRWKTDLSPNENITTARMKKIIICFNQGVLQITQTS